MKTHPKSRQRGVSIIAAVFIITGLLALGLLIARLMMMSSTTTLNEWYSAQAYYAAESGIDCAAYNAVYGTDICGGGSNACDASNCPDAQFLYATTVLNFGTVSHYQINSTGSANGLYGPVQRQIITEFFP